MSYPESLDHMLAVWNEPDSTKVRDTGVLGPDAAVDELVSLLGLS